MADRVTRLRLFASSPEDVSAEREEGTRKAVTELNRGVARDKNLLIEVITWRDVTPGPGPPEQVILDQIGKFDIFVGIMGASFGSRTGQYESGTEEEFYKAYNSWVNTGRPQILFYFKKPASAPRNKKELNQYSKVLDFKEKFKAKGLFCEFNDYQAYEALIRDHLTSVVRNWREPFDVPSLAEEQEDKTRWWRVWQEAYPSKRKSGERVEAFLVRQATRSVKFMTISGRSIYDGRTEENLVARARTGFTVRLLLFDWNSPWFRLKMKDERREEDHEIQWAREKAAEIARQFLLRARSCRLDMHVKVYTGYPVWRMLIADEETAYVGHYPKGGRGYEGPMYVYHRSDPSGVFYPIHQSFDMLWLQSGDPLQPDDARFQLKAL